MPGPIPRYCYTRQGLWAIIISQEQEITRLRKTVGNMKGVFAQHKLNPYAVPGVREVDEAEALDQAEELADADPDDPE